VKEVFKWKDGKVFFGRKSYMVTYSENEYVILTIERRAKSEKEE